MNAAQTTPPAWPGRRWWLAVAIIFAGQIGLVFWLGERGPLVARPPAAAPVVRLAGAEAIELLQLQDPTLFARPHWDVFSGPAWLNVGTNQLPPEVELPEAPRWLELATAELGAAFDRFSQTNEPELPGLLPRTKPELTMPPPVPLVFASEQSSCRVEGDLAGRRLLTPLEPPGIEHTDILNDSVVQLMVDADGRPLSVTLLSSSGLTAADTNALALARAARFAPLYGNGPERHSDALALTWGQMIFEWAVHAPGVSSLPQ
jgi:TonB family protein